MPPKFLTSVETLTSKVTVFGGGAFGRPLGLGEVMTVALIMGLVHRKNRRQKEACCLSLSLCRCTMWGQAGLHQSPTVPAPALCTSRLQDREK